MANEETGVSERNAKIGSAMISFYLGLLQMVIFLATEPGLYFVEQALLSFTQINPILMFILLIWWPTSGRLHMKYTLD